MTKSVSVTLLARFGRRQVVLALLKVEHFIESKCDIACAHCVPRPKPKQVVPSNSLLDFKLKGHRKFNLRLGALRFCPMFQKYSKRVSEMGSFCEEHGRELCIL